jgi:hypothetical protein
MSEKTPADREQLLNQLPPENVAAAARVLSSSGVTALMGEPSAASLVDQPIKVDVSKLANVVFSDSEPAVRNFNLQSAGALAILAWKHTESIHTHAPIWEFLRHVRNAAAHGGRFHFLGNEPSRPAVWRAKTIDRSLQGTPIFAAPVNTGFLGTGDVLYLLADIDAQFIA